MYYFSGALFRWEKLGVPGLINAYKMAAADCLDKANIITVPIKESYNISCSETDMPMVMHELNKSGRISWQQISQKYVILG